MTDPDFTGWNGDKKYSWVKAPRFNGAPMQVGPLSQVLVGFAQGHPLTKKYAVKAIDTIGAVGHIQVTPGMLELRSTPRRARNSLRHVRRTGAEAPATADR